MSNKILKISESITAGNNASDPYIVPNGKAFEIRKFIADGATSDSSVACLVWDYGGASPEIIWTTKDKNIPFVHSGVGDGVKKIAIECQNNHSSEALIMSAYAEIYVF